MFIGMQFGLKDLHYNTHKPPGIYPAKYACQTEVKSVAGTHCHS